MNRNPASPREAALQQALTNALTGAVERIQAGRLDEAIEVLQSGGGLALKNPVGRNILGDIRLKQGNPRDALKAFDAAVKMAPAFPEAHCNRGVALQEMGRLQEALAAEERALRHRPGYAMAHYNRGNILKELGRLDEAVAAYDRALKEKRALAEAHLNRGLVLAEKNRLVEALADFRQAQALKPDLIGAYLGQSGTHRRLGQKREALAAVDVALAVAPDNADALIFKTRLLVAAERFDEALAVVDRLLANEPANAVAHSERSTVVRKLKRFDEALAEADEAIRLAPKDAEVYAARAMVLGELARVEEQLETLKIAKRLGASGADFHHAQGIALGELGDLSEAVASFERAITLDPEAAALRHNFGMLLLSLGDFERGWAEHEWRLKDRDYKNINPLAVAPDWHGENLDGKKILVKREQGHGDTIQFARFLPLVAALNARVTLTVPSSLKALFQRAFPAIDVTDVLGLRSGFDYQVGEMSLPHVLQARPETLPRAVPYLFADDAFVAKWRDRLGSEGFKVGIAWQGSPEYARDRYRSIPLRRFQPLAAIPGVRLISIQAINGLDQLDNLPAGMNVESFGAEVGNNPDGFNEVAGLMANLDLVISSDTVSVHLAGALGRPVWVALRYRPDWRWRHEGTDTVWYPTMRLFRQTRHEDWEGVFAEIAKALGDKVGRTG